MRFSKEELSFIPLSGSAIDSYIDELAKLRIEVFREFPYLYEGDLRYERRYLERYTLSDRSLAVLALVNKEIVGATTCLPLEDEAKEFKQPFIDNGFELNSICYFGESIVLKAYRGFGLGKAFFSFREAHAKKVIPNLKMTAFCAVDRPLDHPLKPLEYKPLDEFWSRQGYLKSESLLARYSWKDIDNKDEDEKE